jgi:carbamoyltransferase
MSRDIYVLGVSMSRHDRSACLLKNGRIVGAIAEERLDRRKRSLGKYGHAPGHIVLPPLAAITCVLRKEGITLADLDLVVCGRSMVLCREALLAYLPVPPERVIEPPMPGHHLAHAYSAYGTSPFARSAVLVIDEQGHHIDDQFEKCSWFEGVDGPLKSVVRFMGGGDDLSLGMFYNAFAFLVGLSEAAMPAAGKLMGLAAFGTARPEWPHLIDLDAESGDARVSLRQLDEFFTSAGVQFRPGMSDLPVHEMGGLAQYVPVGWNSALGADLARKAEDELERAVLHVATRLRQRSAMDTLSYAGGVALNCTTNRRLREAGWADVYVHPAATDDGNAVGLALYGWIEALGKPRHAMRIFNPFTGLDYSGEPVSRALAAFGLDAHAVEVSAAEAGADRIARGEVVCWLQGASEWGPRALGARSIIASPLIPGMRDRINGKVKYREAFRPFGISGTADGLAELVETDAAPASLAPYMLAVGPMKDGRLSEVRHADGIVRYQVVDADLQPVWHQLIEAFGRRTGVFAIINTSFNTIGEPLVETPLDAIRQFLVSDADALIMENTLLARADIPAPALNRARAMAWAQTLVDPLPAAMGLASAGYVEAAVNLLDQKAYSEESAKAEGAEALQHYHGLRHRAARLRGDVDAARHHAEAVLRWASLSPEAVQAAYFMAEDSSVSDGRRMAGRLIGGLGRPGAALDFFTNLLDKPSGSPVPPHQTSLRNRT